MTNATMPQPVAFRIEWDRQDEMWVQAHTDEATARDQAERRGGRVSDLITTDQAEAYKDACVRKALEEAAEIAAQKSAVMPHYSDLTRGYAQGRGAAAEAIRALIPK